MNSMNFVEFFHILTGRRQRENEFLKEVGKATRRFFGDKKASFAMRGSDGSLAAFPQVYKLCQAPDGPKTPRAIRSEIYKALDEVWLGRLPPHIYASRWIEDGRADKAYELLVRSGEPQGRELRARHQLLLSRAALILGQYEEATRAAGKALDLGADPDEGLVALADANHAVGMREEAQETYRALMDKYLKGSTLKPTLEALSGLLSLEGHGLRSPVLAIDLLKSGGYPEAAWKWAEDEFYFSPYFRCEHASWVLSHLNNPARALGKFLALTRDMPWVKEAAMRALQILDTRDPGGRKGIMAEERKKLEGLMTAQGPAREEAYPEPWARSGGPSGAGG